MKEKDRNAEEVLKLVMQELGDNPLRKLNISFSLMVIIPFLAFFYLLGAKFFTFNIFVGQVGLIIFIIIIISLAGFFITYAVIRKILSKIVAYAAKAKHSDQLKSTFVATTSHELKSPLSSVKLALDSVLDGLLGVLSKEQEKVLGYCRSTLNRMFALISDLLDLHKIEAGIMVFKREICNAKDILENQIKELEPAINKKHITLRKEFSDTKISFWADEDKITRVVNNILNNAIKYSPENGIVKVKLSLAEQFVKMEFIDYGPGIPADKLEKVFDKFEMLDSVKEGTGLGLAISKDIVELHHGKIWVESQLGKGSDFIIVLPLDLRQNKRN